MTADEVTTAAERARAALDAEGYRGLDDEVIDIVLAAARAGEHAWVSQDEDGLSTDCARCGVWAGKARAGVPCAGVPRTTDGEVRAARASRIAAVRAALVAQPVTVSDSEVGHHLSEVLDDDAPLNEQRYLRVARGLARRFPTLGIEVTP